MNMYFIDRRMFMRKSFMTLGAYALLAVLLQIKLYMAASVYIASLLVLHAGVLAVYVYRTPWRAIFASRKIVAIRVLALLIFFVLLETIRQADSVNGTVIAAGLGAVLHLGILATLYVATRPKPVVAK